jgi:hypothetical protein
MGVDGLFKFILSNYSDVVSELHQGRTAWTTYDGEGKIIHVKEQMDHLYVDLNSIIHKAVSIVFYKPKIKRDENAPPPPPREYDVEFEIQNLNVPTPTFRDLKRVSKLVCEQITSIYKSYFPKKSFCISMVGI